MKKELIIFSISALIFVTPVLARDHQEGRIPDENDNPKINRPLLNKIKILGISTASAIPVPTPTPNCNFKEQGDFHKDCIEDKNDSHQGGREDNNDQELGDENEDHHSPAPTVSPKPTVSPSASPSATPPISSASLTPLNFLSLNMTGGFERLFDSLAQLFSFFSHKG